MRLIIKNTIIVSFALLLLFIKHARKPQAFKPGIGLLVHKTIHRIGICRFICLETDCD
jgi:hypothetical protein